MRLCCTTDGDALDDWSDTNGCDRSASRSPLSLARRHEHRRRLQKLPQSLWKFHRYLNLLTVYFFRFSLFLVSVIVIFLFLDLRQFCVLYCTCTTFSIFLISFLFKTLYFFYFMCQIKLTACLSVFKCKSISHSSKFSHLSRLTIYLLFFWFCRVCNLCFSYKKHSLFYANTVLNGF